MKHISDLSRVRITICCHGAKLFLQIFIWFGVHMAPTHNMASVDLNSKWHRMEETNNGHALPLEKNFLHE
jgi:hypothetical protein